MPPDKITFICHGFREFAVIVNGAVYKSGLTREQAMSLIAELNASKDDPRKVSAEALRSAFGRFGE